MTAAASDVLPALERTEDARHNFHGDSGLTLKL
jgi:hypothetical protein